MKKYIVLSVNDNVDYLYFTPLVCWAWRKFGWEPIVFYRGETNTITDLMTVYRFKAYHIRHIEPIEGIRDATLAQCSRLYAGCLNSYDDGINDDDYLMLGDADMLALSDHWKPNTSKVTVYNHDLTGFGEIPMCYVGAPVTMWREIMNLKDVSYNEALKRDISHYPNAKDQDFYKWWGCDQQILTARLKEYGTGKIDFINRGQGSHGYARGRVDRGSGGWVLDQPELIDAHLQQQTHHSQEKIESLMQLLRHVWPGEDFTWFEDYTKEFKRLAV